MTPRAFRDLPRQDQIEMMAHRREKNLRDKHAAEVERNLPPPGDGDKAPDKPRPPKRR